MGGAGATASAVVGDLMQIMRSGRSYAEPVWEKTEDGLLDIKKFKSRHYIAMTDVERSAVIRELGDAEVVGLGDELAVITPEMSEKDISKAIKALKKSGAEILSRIRLI